MRVATGSGWELREGDWCDVLADVEADALRGSEVAAGPPAFVDPNAELTAAREQVGRATRGGNIAAARRALDTGWRDGNEGGRERETAGIGPDEAAVEPPLVPRRILRGVSEMTNKETAKHLREWVEGTHGHFSWPTDGCGYEQHCRFVDHRNRHWVEGAPWTTWREFVLDYAARLESGDLPEVGEQ